MSLSSGPLRALVVGGRGTLGSGFLGAIERRATNSTEKSFIACTSRNRTWVDDFNKAQSSSNTVQRRAFVLDPSDEEGWIKFTTQLSQFAGSDLNLVLNACGTLHAKNGDDKALAKRFPEVSMKMIGTDTVERAFKANYLPAALMFRHIIADKSLLPPNSYGAVAILSAKVGSISENSLGGWYSYRASKAAVNQLVKTASVEMKRVIPNWYALSLHPGTVVGDLSDPYMRSGKRELISDPAKVATKEQMEAIKYMYWTPDIASEKLLDVVLEKGVADSGGFFDYKGQQIDF